MYIRRRKSFFKLVDLIRRIECDAGDLEAVHACNRLILAEIVHAEQALQHHRARHRELKRALKTQRNDRATSAKIRTKMKRAKGLIVAQEDRIFIWKCFGDALAFLYLDKFSIKHAFFEFDRLGVKRDAGLLGGKVGLAMELECLDAFIAAGIPAVLCDITNVLRYGDVCLLAASDPLLFEVKTSGRLNQRGQRQVELLDRLHKFLETDVAKNFRGFEGSVRRVAFDVAERTNINALNACIAEAKQAGQAVVRPEDGVTIAAIYGAPNFQAIIESTAKRPYLVFTLNSDKNNHAWSPYLPFTLSIRDGQHLLDFIEGRLYLIVLIDPQPLCDAMARDEWRVRYMADGDYSIQCFHPPSRSYLGVSAQFLSRAAYDFSSLGWIAEVHRPSIEALKGFAGVSDDDAAPAPGGEGMVAHEGRLRAIFGDDPWIQDPEAT